MDRRMSSLVFSAFAIAAAAMVISACQGKPVGRKCFIGDEVPDNQSVIASPALECPSGQCLQVPLQAGVQLPEGSEYTPQCTDSCEADDDCETVPESKCQTGFTCGIPVVVGPFCCRKLCICKDFLILPEDGLPIPAACDPAIAENNCCNLSGRDDLPECQ